MHATSHKKRTRLDDDIERKGPPSFIWDNGDGRPLGFWMDADEPHATGDGWYNRLYVVDGVLQSESGMGGLSPWCREVQRLFQAWKDPTAIPEGVCL
jgi:hypothetical protein